MSKTAVLILVLGLILTLSGCVSAGDPVTETFNVDLEDISEITLDLSISDLTVKRDDVGSLYIDYRTYENGPELEIREGKTLRIKEEHETPLFFNYDSSPEVTVYLPEDYDGAIGIKTSSGDVDAEDLILEELSINASSGDIYLYSCDVTDLVLDLSSGDIVLEEVTSTAMEVDSSSGDTELMDVTGRIDGKSSSGDVSIEVYELNDDISYELSSGDFTLDFNEPAKNIEFDLKCSSGDIDLSIGLDHYSDNEDNEVRGRIGNGTYEVEVYTSSGDIEIWD